MMNKLEIFSKNTDILNLASFNQTHLENMDLFVMKIL